MQHELSSTLARVIGSPVRRKRKIDITAKQLADVLLTVTKKDQPDLPDAQAIRFYALNQLVSRLFQKFTPNELLPGWAQSIAESYEQELMKQTRLMTWYTFLVISREFRHLKNPAKTLAGKEFSQGLKDLLPTIQDSNDESTLNTWLKNVPSEPLDHYCRCLAKAFNTGSWGSGYGGKPWGMIATTMAEYIAGNTSAEVFVDTAYTLAHNNGPMFNKGMFYKMYTGHFKSVLDVQRAGMVCEGVLDDTLTSWVSMPDSAELLAQIKNCKIEIGGIGDYIDWYAVENLGALGSYSAQKAKQDKLYGKKPVVKLHDGKPVKTKGTFELFPGQSVEIFERMTTA